MGSRIVLVILLLSGLTAAVVAESSPECDTSNMGECYDRPKSLKLKVIAIATILVASMIGICLPLVSRSVPALSPERSLFFVVKAFASGVILSTGFMHVLPDSFAMLQSPCLPRNPWQKFPFTAFVSMLSSVATLMLDSFSMSFYTRRHRQKVEAVEGGATPHVEMVSVMHTHGHCPSVLLESKNDEVDATLKRNRVIAQVGAPPRLSEQLSPMKPSPSSFLLLRLRRHLLLIPILGICSADPEILSQTSSGNPAVRGSHGSLGRRKVAVNGDGERVVRRLH